MTEDALLRALPRADRLRIAAVDLAITGAPRALVVACWRPTDALERSGAGMVSRRGVHKAARLVRAGLLFWP